MDVLVFGGSFDPAHLGHKRLLEAGIRRLRPALAYVVPAWRSPLKSGHGAGPQDRLAMAKTLAGSLPAPARGRVRLERFELDRRRVTYTFELLRMLRRRHPGSRLWFLIGSDSLASFDMWKRPGELRRSAAWLVGKRPGDGLPDGGWRKAVAGFERLKRLPGLYPDVSSTGVRGRVLAGLCVARLVPAGVARIIGRRRLYGVDIRRAVRKALKPGRWRHTGAVSRLAFELADRHGLDPEAAALAGLLHDCGRRVRKRDMAAYCREHGVAAPWRELLGRKAPVLLHSFISAHIAAREYGVGDPAVLSAIRNHTLGAAGMPALDRALYVADLASEDRDHPEAARLRGLAMRDLDKAMAEAALVKAGHAAAKRAWLHPGTSGFLAWVRTELAGAAAAPAGPGRNDEA